MNIRQSFSSEIAQNSDYASGRSMLLLSPDLLNEYCQRGVDGFIPLLGAWENSRVGLGHFSQKRHLAAFFSLLGFLGNLAGTVLFAKFLILGIHPVLPFAALGLLGGAYGSITSWYASFWKPQPPYLRPVSGSMKPPSASRDEVKQKSLRPYS